MSELMTTTYSMWRLFRNCRMACKWRYIDELVPLERDPNLAFGAVIHDCLECCTVSGIWPMSSTTSTGPIRTGRRTIISKRTGTWLEP